MLEGAKKQEDEAQKQLKSGGETSQSGDLPAKQAGAAMRSSQTKKSSAAFRTISEVADDLGVQQHVLRFWETKFSYVKPLKRGGGRRYYRPEDISLLRAIHHLLYVEGYTIKGVQKLLRDVGKKQIIVSFGGEIPESAALIGLENIEDAPIAFETQSANAKQQEHLTSEQRQVLQSVLDELKDLRGMIRRK